MPSSSRIRPASARDERPICALVRAAYAPYVARMGRAPAPMTADYRALIRAGAVWVAVEQRKIVGVLVLLPQPEALLLENVAVDPKHQRRGIGRALIAFAEEQARQLGLKRVSLYTNERMYENLALYPRLDYVEVGRHSERGFQRVFFAKELGP